jgi:hypothetical protein
MSKLDQNTPRRFVLNNRRDIIDLRHSEKTTPSYMNYNRRATSLKELEVEYDDDLHLREIVLKARLQELAGKLLKRPDEAGSLGSLLWEVIVASQLNRRPVPISAGCHAKGKLNRRKNLILRDSSISRFIVELERLLTDLYGDAKGEDFRDLIRAVEGTVIKVLRRWDPDLWLESQQAGGIDCGSLGEGRKAAHALESR